MLGGGRCPASVKAKDQISATLQRFIISTQAMTISAKLVVHSVVA